MTAKDAIIEVHERDSNFTLDVSGTSTDQDGASSIDIESESENSSAYTEKTSPGPEKLGLKVFVPDVEQGTDLNEDFELPEKQSILRRKSKLPFFSQYRRLAAVITVINLALLAVILAKRLIIDLAVLGYMVIANVFVSIVIREQSVINFLFWIATRPSRQWPLSLRWRLGKIYHFGGLHSGCSGAATIWMQSLVAQYPEQLHYQVCYEKADTLPPHAHLGIIERDWLAQQIAATGASAESLQAFVIGPHGFMQSMIQHLSRIGVPLAQCHHEHFGPSAPLAIDTAVA